MSIITTLLHSHVETSKTLHGFQLLEAFHFAIHQVNDKSGMFANILKNVKLGGIGLDACESAIRGGYLVSTYTMA